MDNLYSFVNKICKSRDMKMEDLQKKLDFSRSTLYRYLKGINQLTPDIETKIITALNLDRVESMEFMKYSKLSAYDQSLIEARFIIDKFLFEHEANEKPFNEIDLIFYNQDRFLRTLPEIFEHINTYGNMSSLNIGVKILNCLNDNIFFHINQFLQSNLNADINIVVEHFVNLSEKSYLQNAMSFIQVFPLIKYESYRLYYKEKETEEILLNDSMLISLDFLEEGKKVNRYFAISFFEDSMPECIAFTDSYMYNFLLKAYSNLKFSYDNVIQKYNELDFDNDILAEFPQMGSCYIIKANPCHDKVPLEVYINISKRMSEEELRNFLSGLYGKEIDAIHVPHAIEMGLKYIENRITSTYKFPQIDVYNTKGIIEMRETGMINDQVEHLLPLSPEEIKMVLQYLLNRHDNPNDTYKLYITEKDLAKKDLIIIAVKGYGIAIEYAYPQYVEGLWRLLFIQSSRLASIFCDYFENHLPISHAMDEDNMRSFLNEIIQSL